MPEPLCRNIEAGSEIFLMPDSDVDEIVTDNADVAVIRIGVRNSGNRVPDLNLLPLVLAEVLGIEPARHSGRSMGLLLVIA